MYTVERTHIEHGKSPCILHSQHSREVVTYRFICTNGMNLCAEHDTGEEREEKAFKNTKQREDEGQRTWHEGITVLKVLSNASEEEPRHHPKTKHRHGHDVEL